MTKASIGTHHFRSLGAARRYYARQGYDALHVSEKLLAAEIAIGAPEVKAKQYYVTDRDGRYVIHEIDMTHNELRAGNDALYADMGYPRTDSPVIDAYRKKTFARHQSYFMQFVTDTARRMVLDTIGRDTIKDSEDLHFNDIPMMLWNKLSLQSFINQKAKGVADGCAPGKYLWSHSDNVCVAKAIAREYKEKINA